MSWWDKQYAEIKAGAKEELAAIADAYYELINDTFRVLTEVITTVPIDLISDTNALKLQFIFMGYSVVLMTLLAIVEGYKAIMGLNYTKPTTIFGRAFVAIIGAGLTFPIVIWLARATNVAVGLILSLSETYFPGGEQLGTMLRNFSQNGFVSFLISIIFMIAFLYFIFVALFKVGRRWFDLLMGLVTSPFAWAAYVTDGTSKHLTNFMSRTGKNLLINVVYAFYVVVISVIVLAPIEADTFIGWISRLLLIIGGLWSLSSPPTWVTNMDSPSLLPGLKRFFPFGKKR